MNRRREKTPRQRSGLAGDGDTRRGRRGRRGRHRQRDETQQVKASWEREHGVAGRNGARGGRAGWARVSHGPGGVARGSASDARGRRLRRPSRLCSLRRRRAGRAVSRRGRGALPAGLPVRRCSADGRGRGKGAARDPATARAVQLLLVTCSCMQNVVGELGGTRTACGVCCAALRPIAGLPESSQRISDGAIVATSLPAGSGAPSIRVR